MMKLSKLLEMIEGFNSKILDLDVVVQIEMPFITIGPIPTAPVIGCNVGFDWNAGKFIIVPETPLMEKDVDFAEKFKALQDKAGWLEYENRNLKSQIKKLRKTND